MVKINALLGTLKTFDIKEPENKHFRLSNRDFFVTRLSDDELAITFRPLEEGKRELEFIAIDEFKILSEQNTEIYEPYIVKAIEAYTGENIIECECLYEKTCGAVIHAVHDGQTKYFLVENADSKHVGFPKGHVEFGETEIETAIREVLEETQINVVPDGEFRYEYTFTAPSNARKRAVYFEAEYDYKPAEVQKSEVSDSWFLPFEEAMQHLNYEQDRNILREADEHIKKKQH